MATRWRQYLVFGLGLLLGVAAGAAMLVAANDWRAREQAQAAAAQPHATLPQAQACDEAALLAAAGPLDGQFGAPPQTVDKTRYDVTAYQAIGDEAAQLGRVRDAEVAFLAACRIAARLAQDDPPVLGDGAYRLARHYLAVAAADPSGALREQQLARAETMFRLAMQAYAAKLGQAHEKTRLAAAGMTLAEQAAAFTAPLQAAALPKEPASSPVAVALAAGAPPTATLGGPAEPAKTRPPRAESRPRPAERLDAAPAVQATDIEAARARLSAPVEAPAPPRLGADESEAP